MSKKLTYEKLEQRVRDLEKAYASRKQPLYEFQVDVFQEILENLLDASYKRNLQTNTYDYLSPAFTRISGYTPEEMKAFPIDIILDLIHPKDLPEVNRIIAESMSGMAGTAYQLEYRFRHKKGEYVWLLDRFIIMEDVEGNIATRIGCVEDITDRKQLEDQLHLFKSIVENSKEAVAISDQKGQLVYINPAHENLFKRSLEEARKLNYRDYYPPESIEVIANEVAPVLARGESWQGIIDVFDAKGRRFPLWESAGSISDVKGNMLYGFGFMHDDSNRKQAEEALRESKQRLDGILCGTNSGTWEWNVQTGEMSFNERWANIIGYTLHELEPISIQTWIDVTHPEDFKVSTELLEKHFKREIDYYECECRMKHKDGSWVWVLDRGKVISWTEDNKPLAISGTHQDVTKRRQVEEALKESEMLLKETQRIAKMGGWEYNVQTNVATFTDMIFEIYGETFSDPEEGIKFYHIDDRMAVSQSFENAVAKNEPYDIEVRLRNAQGDNLWVRNVGEPVVEDGKVVKIIGNLIDITERKKLESQLQQSQKMESIGTLAGGIAHDFNNLLYVAMGNISLAQDDLTLEVGTSENLKEAEKACIKAKELSARLITFSKGGDPVKKISSIDNLLKITIDSALTGSNVKPKLFISDAVRQVNIDEGQIKQVVHNIAVNAREAMDDDGELTVSCENIDIAEEGYLSLTQGEYIKISFEDQGCGISKENLEKIFDPYFTTKDMGVDKGQGLGLTVSYSIVQKHGGLINVESELGTGSIFSVYLPAISVKKPDSQKSVKKPATHTPVKQSVTGTGKILLMDDEEAIRIFMGQVLNRLGYDGETCTEGKETVEIYKKAMESEEPFDVVILDLTNKIGMGGQETMKTLLEIDQNAKGIVITGYSSDPVVSNYRAYGFSGFLTKPATNDELNKVISRLLSKNQ